MGEVRFWRMLSAICFRRNGPLLLFAYSALGEFKGTNGWLKYIFRPADNVERSAARRKNGSAMTLFNQWCRSCSEVHAGHVNGRRQVE